MQSDVGETYNTDPEKRYTTTQTNFCPSHMGKHTVYLRGRQRRRENGVPCPCMDMPRHSHVVPGVRVLDRSLPNNLIERNMQKGFTLKLLTQDIP